MNLTARHCTPVKKFVQRHAKLLLLQHYFSISSLLIVNIGQLTDWSKQMSTEFLPTREFFLDSLETQLVSSDRTKHDDTPLVVT